MERIHAESRAAAGASTVSAMLKAEGEAVGCYKAARLMAEANLESRQPRHRYKITGGEGVIAPNHLNRAFTVNRPNAVWCGTDGKYPIIKSIIARIRSSFKSIFWPPTYV